MPSTCLTLRSVKTERTGIAPNFLRDLRDFLGLTTFIETGTYQGATTAVAAKLFEEVHTIELAPALHAKAAEKFAGLKQVHTHLGDSGKLLPEILRAGPREKILFWLDGHYSGGSTAKGEINTPILDELRALAAAGLRDCVVLVDDLRIFQRAANGADASLTGYPTFAELRDALRALFPNLCFAHFGDIAIACDASSGLEFSPVVSACTASRLYDAAHEPDDGNEVVDLFKAEQLIAAATGVEAAALLALAETYPSAEKHGLGGHYHLWAALVLAQQRDFGAALKQFNRALELGCKHWRLQCYLAACLDGLGERAEALLALNEARHVAPEHPLLNATHESILGAPSSSVSPRPTAKTSRAANPADLLRNGEQGVLRQCITPGSVVFDVGANEGAWSTAVLEHTRPAQLHLFEPLPEQTRSLRTRFADGVRSSQVNVNPCAVSDRTGTRDFHYYTASPAWSTFHRRVAVERSEGVAGPEMLRVETTTLDEYCERAGIARIGFLKIDVEGGELEVLRGARGLLQRGDIDYIQFEYGGTYTDAGATLREAFAFLKQFGCELFKITPQGLAHCPQFAATLEDFQYANYLAAHPRFRATLLREKPRMLDLAALAREHHLAPRGVIHIGAHEGKEFTRYREMGFQKILFIEANPAVFAKLQANSGGQPGVLLANVAISDRNGTAQLRVTSMDQSSSLLPLKLHKKIYPDIVETQTVEVRTVTLDALLAEMSLDPAEFNFLNIDIQGAELLALRGAEKTLRHIEGINTEVNLAELYEGCARLEEIDSHLQRRDFARVAMTTPFHPSWGDAFYVRQSVITMSSLGGNGRFANQLFQYAFLKCYARDHALRVETPAWVGQRLFGCADPAISRRLPEVRERSNLLADALVPNAPEPFRNADFWGFFQYNTRYYAPHRDYLRSLFRPTPAVCAHVQPMLERLRRRGKTVVGLHLRRGDYGYEHFFIAPTAWYLDWLRGLWPTLDQPVLFIASDEPAKVLADFAEFNPITVKDLGPALPGAEFYPDFFLLSQCDALAISNSSFSFAAALLNERATIFARPHLPTARLIPFDPWNSETIFRDAKVEASKGPESPALAAIAGARTPSPLNGERAGVRGEASPTASIPCTPRFSFVTIVLNGMPFLEYALRAVYEFAHEIIIVEGAVENCRFAAKPEGSSTDGTVECLRNFPDPQKKIRVIQGAWPEKCEMQNAALAHITGDYVWLMDADEIYRRADLEKVRQLVQQDPAITQINFIPDNFWKGFDHIFIAPRFAEPAAHYRRVFKFAPGAKFTSHRPPTMRHPGAKRTTEQQRCIPGDVTRAMGIVPFHYSYVSEAQVAQKVELYNRYGWAKEWKLDLNEWLRECWQKWTPENRAEIERRYPVWTGGRDSHTEVFTGEHPEVMREFIASFREQQSSASKPRAPKPQSLLPAPYLQRLCSLLSESLAAPGDVIEVGVYKGGSLYRMAEHLTARHRPQFDSRRVIGIDTFTGHPYADPKVDPSHHYAGRFAEASFVEVRAALKPFAFVDLLQGECGQCFESLPSNQKFCFANIDVDIAESAIKALDYIYPRLSPGGVMVFDEYQGYGQENYLNQFFKDKPVRLELRTGLPKGDYGLIVHKLAAPAAVAEPELLPVIGGRRYLRLVLNTWQHIELDAPLIKRRVEIERHLAEGTSFFNNHVGLAFLADRLDPKSYLEIGVRNGGSFVQVLANASPVTAVGVDLWSGLYSDLPNTREFAVAQITRLVTATGKQCNIELRQGNSHVELKKLLAEGRKFDLINVDGDHTDSGALEDLEDALALLSERGAILFDDIIHPGFRSLLGVVKGFAARRPDLQLLLNTTQDNGVAILLKGVSVSELLESTTSISPERSGAFPLTPALSPGERETLPPRSGSGNALDCPERGAALLPLPAGEGRGEGNRDVRPAFASQSPRRLKIAGEVATKADLTQIDSKSAFAQAIRKLFAEIRPTKIIETGTYLGTGTTQVIAETLRDLKLEGAFFHSIEVKPQHHETAQRNLTQRGLAKFVQLHLGLSVPRRLLPTLRQIEEQTVRRVEFDDLFVDHQEQERALLYFKETDFANAREDMLGQCLREFGGQPDFVLLDSGGHIGHVEFTYLLSQLTGPCHLALDDIHHIKHAQSFRQMQADPRFEMLASSKEKFGFCLAKFTPAKKTEPDATVQRLLWVRTDAIGDAVLAASMLPHVRAKYPCAKIAVLCRQHVAELYLACPHVESVICFDWPKAAQDDGYRRSIIAEIAAFQPDLVLNPMFSREPVTELLALTYRAPQIIGLEGNLSNISAAERKKLDPHYTRLIASPGEHKPELERHCDFLAGLGVHVEKLEPQVWTTPEDEALADAFFTQEKLDTARTVALFPGAQNDRRIYEHYAAALQPLRDHRFLIFGDAKVSALADEISRGLPGACLNLAGKTSLREMAALLRRCRLYVGAESAGAHLACALGVPNVVVLGGGHFGRFMPYSPLTSAACLPLDCFGCDWRCRHAKPHCVKDVAPEVITEAIRQTLAKPSTRTRFFMQGAALWTPQAGRPRLASEEGFLAPGTFEMIEVGAASHEAAWLRRPVAEGGSDASSRSSSGDGGVAATPLVTAIVSAYNSEKFLRGCLEDLEAQTIADRLEIIVVDSGSEQNERAIVEEFQQRHGNIVYLRTEREPLYAAWNRAIAIARGKYLTNANTDDRHRPDAYEILARTLDEHPVGLVFADSLLTRVENETFATTKAQRTFQWPEFTLKELLLRNYFGPHPMWRRSVHDAIGLFNPDYTIAGDYDFNLRLTARFSARRVDKVLGLYYEGGLEWQNREKCVQETRRLLHHHRRKIAMEDVYPALRQADLPPRAKAEALVDYAVALTRTWHPDRELARELYQRAHDLSPQFVQSLENDGRHDVAATPRRREVDATPSSRERSVSSDDGTLVLRRGAAATSVRRGGAATGCSFCIITNGRRPEKLRREIESIRALSIPAYEILVGGEAPAGLGEDVIVVPVVDAARNGRLGEMRNRLVERARFDHIVVADDDMIFHDDFFTGLQKSGEDYEVQCVRLLNPDGTRFWDWATVGGPRGQTILDYDETDPFVYVTGGLCVMKASVADRVKWDEVRGFYQAEDVDFSRRLQQAGVTLRFNRHCTVTHNDARYTLDGPVVVRVEAAFALAKQDYDAGRRTLARHRLDRALRLWPGAKAEVLEFAASVNDAPAIEGMIGALPHRAVRGGDGSSPRDLAVSLRCGDQPSPPRTARFEMKLPVRWAGPVFSDGDAARRAAALLQPLAARLWLGALHRGAEYSDVVVAAWPEAQREALFALADRFPAMLGGIGISHAAPEKFVKLPDATWSVGLVAAEVKRLSPEQVKCCGVMDEVWVNGPGQVKVFVAGGVPAGKLHVVRSAEEMLAHVREIETQVLADTKLAPVFGLRQCSGAVPPVVTSESGRGLPQSKTLARDLNHRNSECASGRVRIAWEGSFLDLGSLSHVNRELTSALAAQPGVEVTCIGRNMLPIEAAKMPALQEMARRLRAQPPQPPQVTVRHAWPPNWEAPKAGAWVLIQPWEFGVLPVEWVRNLARVDEAWVPSEFVRRCYVESGVDVRKVHVVPNGIDAELFRPDAKPVVLAAKKNFKFLFVGGTIHRKGPDLLLKAFLENFTAADDVCLVIKDFGGQSVYAGQTFEQQIRAAQARPDAPEILYLNNDIAAEEMPGLYTACDCLVHPYRGEGFGLPVLEAMACGLPVVVTGGGSTDDFATDEFAYRLPAVRKEFGASVSGMKLVKPGWLLEPDFAALVERMKWMPAHREEARTRGRAASEHVRREWTWQRAAQITARRLREIVSRREASTASKPARTAKPIELPACAKVGHVGEARALFKQGRLRPAWNAAMTAAQSRPCHPEALLLLAEIACAAGDAKRAKALAKRANELAPKWKPAKQFLKSPPRCAATKIELPELSRALGIANGPPRLTVCLITKNEERFIGQCLESVRGIADQIVLVDTGSTDWTTSIAGRFGAEIHKFEWCDDFSAARNAALEKATGDWVLMLDADEELPAEQREKLLALLRDTSAMAFRLPILDVGREDDGVSYVPRLYRNAPGLFYVGRVHEQVFSSIEVRRAEWGLENKLGDATLRHHGYTKELVRSRDKIARNLRLLEMAVAEMPGEPNLLMNLGLELVRAGRSQEGLEQYAAAFTTMSALPKEQIVPELRESLLTQFATHLLNSKQAGEVVRVFTSSLAKAGGLTASMHWLLGLAHMEAKQLPEGAEQMRQCLAKRNQPALSPVHKDVRKAGPHHCLALCLAGLKQTSAADEAFRAALQADPNARTVRFDYARFLAETGQAIDALKWLHRLASEDASELRVWVFGGQVALSRREYLEFAGDWTAEAIKAHPDDAGLTEQRAQALLLSGRPAEALPLWSGLAPGGSPARLAAAMLCEICAGRTLRAVPGELAGSVNQEFVQWYRRLLQFGASSVVLEVNRRLDQWREVLPAAAELIGAAVAEAA